MPAFTLSPHANPSLRSTSRALPRGSNTGGAKRGCNRICAVYTVCLKSVPKIKEDAILISVPEIREVSNE